MLRLLAGEPEAGPWHAEPLAAVADGLMRLGRQRAGDRRPVVREGAHLIDMAIWVQSDEQETEYRNLARVGQIDGMPTEQDHRDLMAEEIPFQAGQRPWEHADLIACGTPQIPYNPATELVIAPPVTRSR